MSTVQKVRTWLRVLGEAWYTLARDLGPIVGTLFFFTAVLYVIFLGGMDVDQEKIVMEELDWEVSD